MNRRFHSDILPAGGTVRSAGTQTGPIRVAIVGLGGIAVPHLRKLGWMAQVEIVGVCDRSAPVAAAVAERFGVGPAFADSEEMLEAVQPDAVHVLTPPQTHRDIVLAALAHRAHVFVEKPMATSPDDYRQMREAARDAGRLLIENYNYRFVDVVLEAIARQRTGAIGDTVTIDVSMSVGLAEPGGAYADPTVRHFGHELPGGAMFNFASHPASVLAATMDGFGPVAVWRGRRDPAALSDDELRAVIAGDGCAAVVTLTSHARPSAFTISLRGTEGVLEVDVYNRRLYHSSAGAGLGRLTDGFRHGLNELSGATALAARYATARHDYFSGLGVLLNHFYAAVAGQQPPPIPTAEMDAANALLFALSDPGNLL